MTAVGRPGTPAPPAAPAAVKACCAEVWSHPAVRLLVGQTLRPGGGDLTGRLLDALDLPAGSRVLDVGCGPGTTLRLAADRGLAPVGLDYSLRLAGEAAGPGPVVGGDAERLPFRAASFDAALVECVVSALPDKARALGELARVLPPGAGLALSDVTATGQPPEPAATVLAWAACTAGALPAGGYADLVESAGFTVESVEDHGAALQALVDRVRRRLALLEGASATGILPDLRSLQAGIPGLDGLTRWAGEEDPVAVAQEVLGQLAAAVEAGDLGYVAVVARRGA